MACELHTPSHTHPSLAFQLLHPRPITPLHHLSHSHDRLHIGILNVATLWLFWTPWLLLLVLEEWDEEVGGGGGGAAEATFRATARISIISNWLTHLHFPPHLDFPYKGPPLLNQSILEILLLNHLPLNLQTQINFFLKIHLIYHHWQWYFTLFRVKIIAILAKMDLFLLKSRCFLIGLWEKGLFISRLGSIICTYCLREFLPQRRFAFSLQMTLKAEIWMNAQSIFTALSHHSHSHQCRRMRFDTRKLLQKCICLCISLTHFWTHTLVLISSIPKLTSPIKPGSNLRACRLHHQFIMRAKIGPRHIQLSRLHKHRAIPPLFRNSFGLFLPGSVYFSLFNPKNFISTRLIALPLNWPLHASTECLFCQHFAAASVSLRLHATLRPVFLPIIVCGLYQNKLIFNPGFTSLSHLLLIKLNFEEGNVHYFSYISLDILIQPFKNAFKNHKSNFLNIKT